MGQAIKYGGKGHADVIRMALFVGLFVLRKKSLDIFQYLFTQSVVSLPGTPGGLVNTVDMRVGKQRARPVSDGGGGIAEKLVVAVAQPLFERGEIMARPMEVLNIILWLPAAQIPLLKQITFLFRQANTASTFPAAL
jgi:hypothetical protein